MNFSRREMADYYQNVQRMQISEISDFRDRGVLVHESQKVSRQIQQVIKEANNMLAFIVKSLEF